MRQRRKEWLELVDGFVHNYANLYANII
jgi:hypothetical protein